MSSNIKDLEKLYDKNKAKLGPEDELTLSAQNNLGCAYFDLGDYTRAEPLLTDCFRRRLKKFGPKGDTTITTRLALASLYFTQKDYEKAEPLLLECIETHQNNELTEPIAYAMSDLATLYWTQGIYEKSQPIFQDVLAFFTKHFGITNKETQICKSNLAILYKNLCYYDEAEVLFKECYNERKQAYGEGHIDTITSLENLSSLYFTMNQIDKSLPLFIQTLELARLKLGKDNNSSDKSSDNDLIMISLAYLGNIYYKQNNYTTAMTHFLEFITIRNTRLSTLTTTNKSSPTKGQNSNLSITSNNTTSKLNKKMLFDLSESKTIDLTLNNDITLSVIARTAVLYYKENKYTLASPLYGEIYEYKKVRLGPLHKETIAATQDLANVYYNSERWDLVEPLFEETLKLRRNPASPDKKQNRPVSTIFNNLNIHTPEKEPVDSATTYLPGYNKDMLDAIIDLANLYFKLRKYNQAFPLYKELIEHTGIMSWLGYYNVIAYIIHTCIHQ